MEIKSKVFKRKSGKSVGKWIVRIEYFDDLAGRTRYMNRHADRRSDAIDEKDRLVAEVSKSHGQIQTGHRMTFADLTEICAANFYQPAVIVEGRKVTGVRSHKTVELQLKVLNQFFGKRLIRQLTTESLTDYKMWRLKNGSLSKPGTKSDRSKKPASIKLATVNRELSAMRRMMRFAYGKGWVTKDIFFNAKVIDTSSEMERTRLLTADEELRLLEACEGIRDVAYTRQRHGKMETIVAKHDVTNPHLKSIILIAIDSGLRKGEILQLRWSDLDLENSLIRVLGTHTKTQRERLAPLSDRTKQELSKLRDISVDDRLFCFADFKRSFATAKRLAGIDDLHFHDLRRTAITRWIQQGNPIALAGKLAGHSQLQTTMKYYTSTDVQMVKQIAENMNKLHEPIQVFDTQVVN